MNFTTMVAVSAQYYQILGNGPSLPWFLSLSLAQNPMKSTSAQKPLLPNHYLRKAPYPLNYSNLTSNARVDGVSNVGAVQPCTFTVGTMFSTPSDMGQNLFSFQAVLVGLEMFAGKKPGNLVFEEVASPSHSLR